LSLLAAPVAAEILAATVTLAPYPGRNTFESGSLDLSYANGNLTITGTAANLTANCTTCGIHVHEGFMCEQSAGHFWSSGDDPWSTTYASDENGTASISVSVAMNIEHVLGRTVVLHDASSRIACGVIMPTLTSNDFMGSLEFNAASKAWVTLTGNVTGKVLMAYAEETNFTYTLSGMAGMGNDSYTVYVSTQNCSDTAVVDQSGKYADGWDVIDSSTTTFTGGYASLEDFANYMTMYLHIRAMTGQVGKVSAGCGKFNFHPFGMLTASMAAGENYTSHVTVAGVSMTQTSVHLIPGGLGCQETVDLADLNKVAGGFGGMKEAWPLTTASTAATATYDLTWSSHNLPGYHPGHLSGKSWSMYNGDNVLVGCVTSTSCSSCTPPSDYCQVEDQTWSSQLCCDKARDAVSAIATAHYASDATCCPVPTTADNVAGSTCTSITNLLDENCGSGDIGFLLVDGTTANCTDTITDCDTCTCGDRFCGVTMNDGTTSGSGSGSSSPASSLLMSSSLFALMLAVCRM
jgi:hypothetical protein